MSSIQWQGQHPTPYWQSVFNAGILNMMSDVLDKAQMNAPRLTGALISSGKITTVDGDVAVVFGSARVKYALMRHEVNNKNPQTKRYLARAAEDVSRGDIAKYFKEAI